MELLLLISAYLASGLGRPRDCGGEVDRAAGCVGARVGTANTRRVAMIASRAR
jgi:hypothetical protein